MTLYADPTESNPVPFLGGQNSGVQICPAYNERHIEKFGA
jgi:hypothetical protein